jgi:hypothetical protein
MSTKPLYDFLLARFTTQDLARFIYFRYPELSRNLPTNAPQAEYTLALIEQLSRQGLLNDEFFSALKEERHNFVGVIESLRQQLAQPGNAGAPAQPSAATQSVVLVFLGANPRDTTPLSLDKERYRVEQVLGRANHGRQAQVQAFAGASIEALRDIVRSYKPAVLHFSGHGNADGELLLEGAGGATEPLNGEALGAWLETRRERPRLLVLNACHGARNALPLARAIDVVIGMTSDVTDDAAMTFSREFYSELGAGETVDQAFHSARAAVGTSHPGEEFLLQMNTRPGVRADQIKILG